MPSLQVDQYNRRVNNQGISPEEMRAIRVELRGDGAELDGQKFDIVVVGGFVDITTILSS